MEAFLKKNAGLTKRQISQAKFRPDGITRNGVRCRVTETIYPGDVIRVCLEEAGTASAHLENYNDGIKSKEFVGFPFQQSFSSSFRNFFFSEYFIMKIRIFWQLINRQEWLRIRRECIIQTASPILLPVTFERKMNRSVSARWGGWIRRLPGLWFLPKIR